MVVRLLYLFPGLGRTGGFACPCSGLSPGTPPVVVPACAGIPAVKVLSLFIPSMNSRSSILLAGTFAAGFLCAWLAKPAESPPPPTDLSAEAPEAQEPRQSRRLTALQRRSSADARIAAFLDDGQDWQPRLDEDYPRLIAALQRRAGLSGLDSRAETILKRLVRDWYDSNPDEALSWVLAIGKPKDETELLNVIVSHLANKDWQAAVALAEQHGAAAGRVIEMPPGVLREMMNTLSPEEFARVYRAGWSRGSLSFNPHGFGNNFQFRETLEACDDGAFPPRVLSGWAMRDLTAAWEWVNESGSENEASLKKMMLSDWGLVADDVEFAEVVSFFISEPDPAGRVDENLRFAHEMFVARATTGMVRSVLEQAPGDRQDNLNRLLRISSTQSGANHNVFREELVAQMSPEERAIAFESNREIFDRRLTGFGHSQEEVDRGDIEGILRVLFDHTPKEIDRMLAVGTSP